MPSYRLCICVVELDPAEKEHRAVHMMPTSEPPSDDVYALIDKIPACLAAMKPTPPLQQDSTEVKP